MRYEVIEESDDWVVASDGCELARYGDQDRALSDVAERLKDADVSAPASLSVRYKTGSSQYWCGIQIIGHRNPLARLEVRTSSGSWVRLARTEYNYFLSEQGSGCGGAIRISDIYGEQLTLDGIAVRPDVVQPTRVQFAAH